MRRKILLFLWLLLSGNVLHAQILSPLQAKGMWIWKLWLANGGNLNTVISTLKNEGITWIVIKMADSDSYYNKSGASLFTWASGYGGMDSVVSIFHANGIKLLGYQYVYGIPHYGLGFSEADVANQILSVKGIDGLLVDAEIQYDTLSTRSATAQSYMDSIKTHYPASVVALTSWARVASHSTFPWVAFLSRVDINMPQTYWAARPTTPATELTRMSNDFTTYTQAWINQGNPAVAKPIMPLGQAEYFGYSNDVAAGDVSTFCLLSQSTYAYPGVSLWEYTQITHSYVWDEYAAAWTVASVVDLKGPTGDYRLSQNFPNPFNPTTTIAYQLAHQGVVTLRIYDVLGREVMVLLHEQQDAGSHRAFFDGSALPSGIYFYKLDSGTYSETRKLVLLK